MTDERAIALEQIALEQIALEQIVAAIEGLSLADQIWLVERLTDRILIQLDQPEMVMKNEIVPPDLA